MAPTPVGSVQGIESLISFGLQVFLAIFGALKHPTTPLAPAQVPAVVEALSSTPGMTADHVTVLKTMSDAAVAAHSA